MIRFCTALIVACLLLTSCGDDEGFTSSPIPSGRLTVINAIPDSPTLSVVTNNISGGNISFGEATPVTNVLPQIPLNFRVSFNSLANNIDQTVDEREITLDIDFSRTILLSGPFDNPVVTEISDPPFDFAADTTDTRIRFINATSSIASATANLINPNGTNQSIAFTNGQPTAFTTTTAGADVQLEITDTSSGAVLWTSGTFILSAAGNRTFVLIDNFGPGNDTVQLISVNDPSGTALFLNAELDSTLRVANHAAVQGPLDVYVDDVLVETVAFNEVSDFSATNVGDAVVRVTPAGDPNTELSSTERTFFGGFFYTLQIVSTADADVVATNLYGEFRRPIANLATVNVTKLAPAVTNIDLYFQNRGEGVTGAPEGNRLPDLQAGAITLLPQEYDLYVTEAGTANVLVGPVPVTLNARSTYTLHITDAAGGGLPLAVQLLDDFQN
ncbi:MAG: DUF4397 domain-containing protein [Pseudomonadales bacterium]